MNALSLYRRYAAACFAGQMQDRLAFAIQVFAGFTFNAIEFVAIALLMHRFGTVGGWTLSEVGLLYGIVHTAFAIADGTCGGFDTLGAMVRSGEFDRILLRPRSTLLQIAGQDLQLRRIGRLSQGGLVLAWGLWATPIAWSAAKVLLLVATLAGGVALFYGIFVLQGALSLFTVEPLEAVNVLTYGAVETAQYPLGIYRAPFRRFFLAVVPVACANYLPLHAVLERAEPLGTPAWVHWASPLAGFAFLALATRVWKAAVRSYSSTGS
jgi:ABC-2 type transport system permease protein